MAAQGDWRHLPHDPAAFFGLEANFDRKDLKRAYGALIRQYKPETHPAEFQRIRAAYEQLDSISRYGVEQRIVAQQTAAWQEMLATEQAETASSPGSTGPLARKDPTERAAPSAKPRRNVTREALDAPEETYRQLADQSPKSPQEYYLLALLSDVVSPRGAGKFLSWLLAGVKAHPRDPGLLAVLAEHLRTDVALSDAPRVLLAVAGAVASDTYYRLTEPLWERMLRAQPFVDFHRVLRQCEEQVRQIDPRPRAIFYLRLLRPALWKADPKWVDRAIALVEKIGAALDEASESELEFISLVRDYQREDRPKIQDREARKLIDEMIRAYCTNDWRTAAAAVATVQDRLARDSHGVMSAFPMSAIVLEEESGRPDVRVLMIALTIAGDVAEQTGVEFDGATEQMARVQAFAALKELGESMAPVGRELSWLDVRMYYFTLGGLVVVPPLILWGALVPLVPLVILSGIAVGAAIIGYFFLLKPRYLDPRVMRGKRQIVLRAYEEAWRPRLFRYVQSCGHAGAAMQRLQELAVSQGAQEWLSVVLSFAEVDPGLAIFSRAQAFAT